MQLATLHRRLGCPPRSGVRERVRRRGERGDVPGWVMITVMSAGLVAGLTALAGPQLKAMLQAALASVGG
ncbi:hypothetical protein [Mumia sp.]|uniref:hypothetical protein n=1 Tax=Mumia sp. TaxID=1965300 RepID=UPI0026115AE3|nr:hypothetical protein [Mumia sp.]MDD9350372.1 hypothetical protein [Mumia sp.]